MVHAMLSYLRCYTIYITYDILNQSICAQSILSHPNFFNFNSTDSKTIPLTISNTGTGTGITIHIEDSILNSLIEKVPWNDVFESFNNKLSRTEETKHIKEHIYKVANEDNTFDHQQWNNFKHNLYSLDRQNQNHWVKHIHPTINVAGKNVKTSL